MAMTEKAMAPSDGKAKTGKLRSINVRKIESGFIGSCNYEGTPGKDGYPRYVPEKEYALADRKAIHEFIDHVFDMKAEEKKESKPRRFGNAV